MNTHPLMQSRGNLSRMISQDKGEVRGWLVLDHKYSEETCLKPLLGTSFLLLVKYKHFELEFIT